MGDRRESGEAYAVLVGACDSRRRLRDGGFEVRIYAYGACAPTENAEIVQQQFRLANSYQRVLVLTERKRREMVDRCYQQACPAEYRAYLEASQVTAAAVDIVRRQRTRPGDMLEPDEEMKAEAREETKLAKANLAAARERESAALAAWREARKRATPKLRPRLQRCDRGARARNKFAYNAAGDVGLAWGTRLKVGESVERAAKAAAKIGTMPHLPRFDGGGMVVVQLQGASGIDDKNGLSVADAFSGKDTRLQINVVGAAAFRSAQGRDPLLHKNGKPKQPADPNSKRSQRRAAATGGSIYGIVRLRIASDGRTPIWASFPVVLSRELPVDAPIKWATVHAHKVGPRTEWRLLLTVDDVLPAVKSAGSVLAINHGWRNLPDGGLRVAYAVGSDGHKEEICVPPEYVTGLAHVESLRSIRDKLYEDAKRLLSDWRDEGERPEWFMDGSKNVGRWRSPKHLAWLVRDWMTRRFDGDLKMFEVFSAWLKKDRHLWRWESDSRDKLWTMRQDFYRCVAARWADTYSKILVTDMDLRDFAELPKPEDGADSAGNVQRRSRFLAAPSELVGAVKNACSTRGTVFEKVDGKNMTRTCNACGVILAFAAKTFLKNTCECGATWDQDENHALNLHARADRVKPKNIKSSVDLEEKKGRWLKRKKDMGADTKIARATG